MNKNPLTNNSHQHTNIKYDKYKMYALFKTRFCFIREDEQ